MPKKFGEFPSDASPTTDDEFLVSNDPAGTPQTRRVSIANLISALSLARKTISNTFTKAQGVTRVPLTDGATISTDATLGNVFSVTLAGNRTLSNPTGLIDGGTYIWIVKQDATGSRTLTPENLFKPTSFTLATAANATNLISCVYDGTNLLCSVSASL